MKLSPENIRTCDRLEREMSIRQSLSAARSVEHAAALALSAAKESVAAALHAMNHALLQEEADHCDDFDMCGEGNPPGVLIFLHREYPTNDHCAKELLYFYGLAIDFANEMLREDLKKYPFKKALQRHEWALTALRFDNVDDLKEWASVDLNRYEWLRSYPGYFGFHFGTDTPAWIDGEK